MWIGDDKVLRTVALPDPTDVMSHEFRAGLDGLVLSERQRLVEVVDSVQERLFLTDWSHLDSSPAYVGAPPPSQILRGAATTVGQVSEALDRVDLRWRLDASLALEDYLG